MPECTELERKFLDELPTLLYFGTKGSVASQDDSYSEMLFMKKRNLILERLNPSIVDTEFYELLKEVSEEQRKKRFSN